MIAACKGVVKQSDEPSVFEGMDVACWINKRWPHYKRYWGALSERRAEIVSGLKQVPASYCCLGNGVSRDLQPLAGCPYPRPFALLFIPLSLCFFPTYPLTFFLPIFSLFFSEKHTHTYTHTYSRSHSVLV